jgi:hypothetical protein
VRDLGCERSLGARPFGAEGILDRVTTAYGGGRVCDAGGGGPLDLNTTSMRRAARFLRPPGLNGFSDWVPRLTPVGYYLTPSRANAKG